MKNKLSTLIICLAIVLGIGAMIITVHAIDLINVNTEPLAADEGGDPLNATITIKYQFDDNDVDGFDPSNYELPQDMTFNIRMGTDFDRTIILSTLLGFEATSITDDNGNDVSAIANITTSGGAKAIDFNLTGVINDLSFIVYLSPIEVNYYIRYYFQDIVGDNYTEVTALFKSGAAPTGTRFTDAEIELTLDDAAAAGVNLEGFTLLTFQPEIVAADGSTVFEVYYDRNYYTVNFDLDGGFGVDPIYERYGADITIPTPTKPGYTFAGWDTEPVSTIGTSNLTYTAQWSPANTTFRVVYWKENANYNEETNTYGYSYWGSKEHTGTTGSIVSADDYRTVPNDIDTTEEQKYFAYESAYSNQNVTIKGDGTTVINVYFIRNFYTITFIDNRCAIQAGHVHSIENGCYYLACPFGAHQHTGECLVCTKEEIPHTEDCCSLTEHVHSEACCTIEQHTHIDECCNKDEHEHDWRCAFGYRCDKEEHTHGEGNCPCKKPIHEHGDGNCIFCNTTVHQHGDGSCNASACSDPTHHEHSDSCYQCDGNSEHQHTDSCWMVKCNIPENHSHTNCKTVKIIKAKYEEDISRYWPITPDYDGATQYGANVRWKPTQSSYYTEVLVYIASMPPDDFTLTVNTSNYTTRTMYYCMQLLPGEEFIEGDDSYKEYNGKQYIIKNTIKANYRKITEAEDYFDIAGYTKAGSNPRFSGGESSATTIYFYYDREVSNTISFDNNGRIVEMIEGIMFEQVISSFSIDDVSISAYVPSYPDNLPPNAYEFAGWYTAPSCEDGTEVDWNMKMPNTNLVFYAKYVPKKYEITFYDDYNKIGTDNIWASFTGDNSIYYGTLIGRDKAADNGIMLSDIPARSIDIGNGTTEELEFVGWFYMDGSTRKAYDPDTTVIKSNMEVFAVWRGTTAQRYSVKYTYGGVEIGEAIVDFARLNSTKTFIAKTSNQLLPEYRSGYFPLTHSTSIVIQPNPEMLDTINSVEFKYVKVDNAIEYTIKYIDKETGDVLLEEVKETTNSAYVEERYVPIDGYRPDSFYKGLVITVELDENNNYVGTDDNVIVFEYTKEEVKTGSYIVKYLFESLEKDGNGNPIYVDSGIYDEGYLPYVGNKAPTHTISSLRTFTGFKYKEASITNGTFNGTPSASGMSFTVTTEGTEVVVKYDRESYPVNIYFYVYGTTTPVHGAAPVKIENNKYGSKLTVNLDNYSVTQTGYKLVGDKSRTITITDGANNIYYYFEPIIYDINYYAVTYNGISLTVSGTGGSLTSASEKVPYGETAVGATPMAKSNYEFVGWYKDAACTIPVTSADGSVSDTTFIPDSTKLSADADNNFYAKFEIMTGTLKIERIGASKEQIFVYRIYPTGNEAKSVWITVEGGSSETVTVMRGVEYTIEQVNSWSWRYADNPKTVTVNAASGEVVFNWNPQYSQWLDGYSGLSREEEN